MVKWREIREASTAGMLVRGAAVPRKYVRKGKESGSIAAWNIATNMHNLESNGSSPVYVIRYGVAAPYPGNAGHSALSLAPKPDPLILCANMVLKATALSTGNMRHGRMMPRIFEKITTIVCYERGLCSPNNAPWLGARDVGRDI